MSDLELRFGGAQAEGDGENTDAQRKAQEREAKKAEVRKRLEQEGKAGKKAKKGFLTPERKKKLRKLLMVKAAEDLKRQQMQKSQERQKVLSSRTIPCPNTDSTEDKNKLESIYNELFQRLVTLEEERYDINAQVMVKEQEINELNIAVNDLRGKFVKPTLKKVSKYDNKFKKMTEVAGSKKTEKADFRTNLKTVKKESAIEIIEQTKKNTVKPVWSKKGDAAKKEIAPKKVEEKPAAPVEEAPPVSEAEEDEVSEAVSEVEVSEAE